MDIYRRIGERIRSARMKLGLTQPQLADLLGLSRGIISRWETGLARPSLDRLEPLAERLNVSIEQLLGFTTTEAQTSHRARTVPVWEIGGHTVPDLRHGAHGEVVVSEQEALVVQAAFLVKDDAYYPYLAPGDIVGVQTAGRTKLGDVVFVRKGQMTVLRHYAGRRKGEVLLSLGMSQTVEIAQRVDILGIFRWLHRPGHIVTRA